MTKQNLTPLEIYKVLEKSNCRQCFLPSCLAFAVGVVAGDRKLEQCPHLSKELIVELSAQLQSHAEQDPKQAEFLDKLEEKVGRLDLQAIAPLVGASYKNKQLTIKSLGKDFHVDQQGKIRSECHIISWVQAPILSYITNKKHQNITGEWIAFRELKGGIEWQGLFSTHCEAPLKKLTDEHPELLGDLVDLFLGKPQKGFEADIALVLYPLPHIPVLICYQAPDDDMGSELTIFFDACCAVNLHIKSIYTLCAGLVKMFAQIAKHHT